jgi:hypothetical protein
MRLQPATVNTVFPYYTLFGVPTDVPPGRARAGDPVIVEIDTPDSDGDFIVRFKDDREPIRLSPKCFTFDGDPFEGEARAVEPNTDTITVEATEAAVEWLTTNGVRVTAERVSTLAQLIDSRS